MAFFIFFLSILKQKIMFCSSCLYCFKFLSISKIINELLKQNRCFQIQSKEYLLTQNTVTSNMKLTIKMIKKRCNLEKQDIIYYQKGHTTTYSHNETHKLTHALREYTSNITLTHLLNICIFSYMNKYECVIVYVNLLIVSVYVILLTRILQMSYLSIT